MTNEDILSRLDGIKELADEPECAHSFQDGLLADFIRYVASTPTGDLAEKAKLVLTVFDIEFERWYA